MGSLSCKGLARRKQASTSGSPGCYGVRMLFASASSVHVHCLMAVFLTFLS